MVGIMYRVVDIQQKHLTGLCELDGTWYYLENGVLDRSKNGVVPFNDEWWYITN